MSKLKPAPKASIKKNAWDNWYGYHGCKKVEWFLEDAGNTQEQLAKAWLDEQKAKGYRV